MQEIELIKSSPENIYLKVWSANFSQDTECLIPDLHPELPPPTLKIVWCIQPSRIAAADGDGSPVPVLIAVEGGDEVPLQEHPLSETACKSGIDGHRPPACLGLRTLEYDRIPCSVLMLEQGLK